MFRLKKVRYMALLLSLVLVLSALTNVGTVHAGEEQNESTEFAVTGEGLGNGSEGVKESGAVGVEPSSDADTVELDGEPACSEEEVFSDSYAGILLQAEENALEDAAEDTGTFVVTGGVYGVDYEYKDITYTNPGYGNAEGYTGYTGQYTPPSSGQAVWTQKSLVIKSEAPLTITTSSPSDAGIYIEPGVHADLTFDNVTINAYLPVNITTNLTDPTSLHLTLADGSENILNCTLGNTSIQAPGIRCGEGSILTIDDGRRNVDQDGDFVAPEQGLISRDAVLKDGTEVKKGDRLTLLDSEDPGTLTVNGGYRAAAIGGGPLENSGEMTFNGGEIHAYAYGPGDGTYGAGCGIGGGHAGGGTVMTFNGGSIDATGSYHGAGIGGGCTYAASMSKRAVTYAFADAVLCKTPSSTIAGDIYINGGFLKSKGKPHSNAFGQGCGGTNTGKTIKITGGTLLPDSTECSSGFKDIGGAGGYVIVTGGSVRLTNNDKSKFQSSDGKAYGDEERTTEVFMTTIDLSSEGLTNNLIEHWKLYIDGELTDYGAPSMLDNGQLYLWLPKSAEGKEVRVALSVQDENAEGGVLTPADLFIADVKEGDATLKRYVEFAFPEEWEQSLVKEYDGLSFEPYPLSEENYLETDEEPAKKLTDPSKVKYKCQYYAEDGETLIGAEMDDLPADSGTFQISMTSTEFADTAGFKESYWGHRAYGRAVITPVDTKTEVTLERPEDSDRSDQPLTFIADIVSAGGTAVTCKAPTGKIAIYVDGKQVKEVPIVFEGTGKNAVKQASDGTGGEHTIITYSLTATEQQELFPETTEDNIHTFTVEYQPDKNYNASSDKLESETVTITPIENEVFEVYEAVDETAANADNQIHDQDKIVKNMADFGDDPTFPLYVKTDSIAPIKYTSSNPGTAFVDEDGAVHVLTAGVTEITVHQDANGAYMENELVFTLVVNPDTSKAPKPYIHKKAENKTEPGAYVQTGDIVTYTISAGNTEKGTVWKDVVIEDKIPAGLELLEDTIHLTNPSMGIDDDLTAGQYTYVDGVLRVPVGVIYGYAEETENPGETVLTFDARVKIETGTANASADIKDITNVATAQGKRIAETDPDGPDPDPDVPQYDPENPGMPVDPGPDHYPEDPDDPEYVEPVTSDPVAPTGGGDVIPADPEPASLSVNKTAQNLTSTDGRTHVGDRIRYEISLSNSQEGSRWENAVILDQLPEGLKLIGGSMYLQTPKNVKILVDDSAYHSENRMIAVYVGDLYGGDTYKLVFEVEVTKDALGKDIGNVGRAIGELPSENVKEPEDGPGDEPGDDPGTDPTPDPEPGSPWTPDDGWDDIGGGIPIDTPEPVYPFERDKPDPSDPDHSGILPKADNTSGQTKGLKSKVPDTGDEATALIPVWMILIMISAAYMGIVWNRKRRNNRI